MEGHSVVPMVSAVSWEWHLCEILRVCTNNTSKPIEHLQNTDQKTSFPTGNAIFWFQSVSQNWRQARACQGACQDAKAAQHRNTGAPRCLGKQALRRHKGVAPRGQRIHQQLIAESRASAVVPQVQNRHPGAPVFFSNKHWIGKIRQKKSSWFLVVEIWSPDWRVADHPVDSMFPRNWGGVRCPLEKHNTMENPNFSWLNHLQVGKFSHHLFPGAGLQLGFASLFSATLLHSDFWRSCLWCWFHRHTYIQKNNQLQYNVHISMIRYKTIRDPTWYNQLQWATVISAYSEILIGSTVIKRGNSKSTMHEFCLKVVGL